MPSSIPVELSKVKSCRTTTASRRLVKRLINQVDEPQHGGCAVVEADDESVSFGGERQGPDGGVEFGDVGETPGFAVPKADRAVGSAGQEILARGFEGD